ncbi:hypothetical protein C8R45DRAFT_121462 [Mycena sanguinolenta]|nr:hypothetical protein C8R45DRAFT_121462 [Mycena sanguinolenta]
MDHIPVEVWLQVFGILDRSDLISLHSVSRSFHRISRPLLFKHFCFHPYAAVPYSFTTHEFLIPGEVEIKRTIRRLRFWASDNVAYLVKGCTVAPREITSGQRGGYAACRDGDVLLRILFDVLPRFTNLRKLSSSSIAFKPRFIDAVQSLPNLKEIELGRCAVDEGVAAGHQLKVEKFSFLDADRYRHESVGAQRWLSVVDRQMLTHLSLLSGTAVTTILNSDTDTSAFPNVVTLAIDVNRLERGMVALHRFPAVRAVRISMYIEPPHSSTASFFPLLERYYGPPEFLVLLDSRAPLRRLQLEQCRPAQVEQILHPCAHTLRSVTTVLLWFEGLPITAFHAIVEAFPSLVELHLLTSFARYPQSTQTGEMFTAQSLYLDLAEASPFPSGLKVLQILPMKNNKSLKTCKQGSSNFQTCLLEQRLANARSTSCLTMFHRFPLPPPLSNTCPESEPR